MRVDPYQYIGYSHELEVCLLGVGEVHLGFPDGLHQLRVIEVKGAGDVLVVEPLVHPCLSQVQIHLVVLDGGATQEVLF